MSDRHLLGTSLIQPVEPFRRDRTTKLCYGALGAYAFWLYAFGPALALLRVQLHLSYTLVGVYSALWAGGAAAVGVTFVGLSRRLGRRRVLWIAALGAIAGAALFTLTRSVAVTLCGAAVMGFAGTTVQTITQSALSDRHGHRKAQALVESNVGAGICAVVAPLAIGMLAVTPAGWRTGMALPALTLAGLYLAYHHEQLPPVPSLPTGIRTERLPLACWLLAALVAVGIAVEFCLVYFGAELLARTGLSASTAATAMSIFYAGILAGRIAAGRLAGQPGRTIPLVWASLAVAAGGFLPFWLSGSPAFALTGLFVCGTGVANLFPLSLALTLAAAPARTDTANALTQSFGGSVVVIAPLLLGALADHLGLVLAFGIELVLLAACALLLVTGTRTSRGARQQ